MKVKWGLMVVAGSGKLGGHVAARNKGGSYFRTKVTPANPQSTSQLEVRTFFTQNAQAWRGLTENQRDAWNTGSSNYSTTNIWGDALDLSGSQLHQQLNQNLLLIGESVITDIPQPQAVDGITSLTVVSDAGAGNKLELTYSPGITSNTTVQVFATAPQSAGKSFVKSEFRKIGNMVTADGSPHDVKTLYITKFGALPPAGSKVFVRMVPINKTTGQSGLAVQGDTIAIST